MKIINNYIKYLLTLLILILLGSITVYAQTTGDLSQIISQANQQLSNLFPSSTSSIDHSSFSKIIKQNIDKFIYYFINYAIPFLFVFLLLVFLTREAKGDESDREISRPLLLLYLIMAFLVTIFFHSVLIVLAIVFTIILAIVGLYKLFHRLTGSNIGLIIGFFVAIVILFVILINDSLKEFLSSTAYFILLFVLFIIIFILGIRAHRRISQYINKIKKDLDDIYRIIIGPKKPQEIQEVPKEIQELAKEIVNKFEDAANNKDFGIISKIDKLNGLLNELKMSRKLDKNNIRNLVNLSKEIKDNYKNFTSEYNMIKEKFRNLYGLIERQYNEPIKSKILGVVRETEEKIDHIKREVDFVYTHKYLQNEDLRRKILNMWYKKNIEKDIIKKLREYIEKSQEELKNFENTIENLDIQNIMNNNLIEGVRKIRNKINDYKEKFDKKYLEAESKLSRLRNSMPNTYNQLKSMLDSTREEFYKIYRSYEELANGLENFNKFIYSIRSDIKELENISNEIMQNKDVPKNCREFYNIYNQIEREINSFLSHSRGGLIYLLLRKLKKHIENYQTKISDKCGQSQNFPHQMSFHYRWP